LACARGGRGRMGKAAMLGKVKEKTKPGHYGQGRKTIVSPAKKKNLLERRGGVREGGGGHRVLVQGGGKKNVNGVI